MFTSWKKAALLTLPLVGVLWLGSPAWAHDDWDHHRLHDQLNEEHGEFHDELGDVHREFHEQPHSAWQHRRFHRDLGRLHRDFDRNLADEHHAYHEREWVEQQPYYGQPSDEDDYNNGAGSQGMRAGGITILITGSGCTGDGAGKPLSYPLAEDSRSS